ncbi:hypothetical protein Tco_0977687 [Tanacetum coccineum]|uniref:Uncharacterized protein n=1 Tax=Tanacetum coccineum TaxID=301880 RepID=A0ABQ5EKV6_9ASTR
MGRGTWYYLWEVFLAIVDASVRSEFEISSWRVARVEVRTYLLGGAIDGSEANGIIRNPKLELESSRSWRKRTKEDTRSRRSTKEDELRLCDIFVVLQGATPICEGSCRLTSLERQEVWNDCRSCKVRVGSNGNLLWEASVLLGRKKGCVIDTLKFTAMPFGLTNAPSVFMELMITREDDHRVTEGREDVRKVFQQRGSGEKRKLYRCGRNQMGNEPILALPEGADNFVVYYDARSKDLKACLEKGRSEFDFEAKYHLGKANVDVVPWSRKKE